MPTSAIRCLFFFASALGADAMSVSASSLAYQTSSTFIAENCAIASRYARTQALVIVVQSLSEKSLSRAPTKKLVARRLISHSKGAGRVSSKSLISKTRFRSGVANRPKLERWQSPQAWTRIPDVGVCTKIHCHQRRCATVKGKDTLCHAAIANRYQVLEPAFT